MDLLTDHAAPDLSPEWAAAQEAAVALPHDRPAVAAVTGARSSVGGHWSRDAVVYQVYLRSFADADGDGEGDLVGLTARLDHLAWLGVDAVWITPHYVSPQADGGYDVADHRAIDPRYGTLADFDALLARAHERGIRVLVDIVPNHTSAEHPWFVAALAAPAGHPIRDRYVFVDPAPDGGPPNNWQSCFGGPAWTLHEPSGQYYLHLYAPEQPDLNWRHADVVAEYADIVKFWVDRGTDGVRVDVAAGLFKDAGLRDNPGTYAPDLLGHGPEQAHTWNQPEVHDIWRSWRTLLDTYDHDPMMVGEVCLADTDAVADYVRSQEMHQALALQLIKTGFGAEEWASTINRYVVSLAGCDGVPGWGLGNHDKDRPATRYGGAELGAARARGALLATLALPGAYYLYAGEELGLETAEVPEAARQDPIFHRSGGTRKGRDGVRIPMPWTRSGATAGFNDTGRSWLPQPAGWAEHSVEAQTENPSSSLWLHRDALAVRRALVAGRGVASVTCHDEALIVTNELPDGRRLSAVFNMSADGGAAAVTVPEAAGRCVLRSDGQASVAGEPVVVPAGACVWVLAGSVG